MGFNLLNGAHMILCVWDLPFSAFCLLCITAQIWLDMIRYHNICKINNVPFNNQAVEADKL